MPVGVVGAITPWKFPLAMITRKVGPALACGCTVVIKPSELTPLTALVAAELSLQAGKPPTVHLRQGCSPLDLFPLVILLSDASHLWWDTNHINSEINTKIEEHGIESGSKCGVDFLFHPKMGPSEGAVNVVMGHASAIGDALLASPQVRKITFTGSTAVGKKLMAGAAGTVKKVSLELGGNAPCIIFDDADLDVAIKKTLATKFRNSGQTQLNMFVQTE